MNNVSFYHDKAEVEEPIQPGDIVCIVTPYRRVDYYIASRVGPNDEIMLIGLINGNRLLDDKVKDMTLGELKAKFSWDISAIKLYRNVDIAISSPDYVIEGVKNG